MGSTFEGSGPAGASGPQAPVPYQPNGQPVPTGIDISAGNSKIPLNSPGSLNPALINPYAAGYLGQNQAMYGGLQSSILSPSQYGLLQDTSQNNLTTAMGNNYARMGLSGSSAEMGGLSNTIQSNQMNWLNRQQSDYSKYLSAGEGLTNQGYQESMGIQGQYGNFQDVYGQDILGAEGMYQQQQIAQQNMIGQITSGALGAAGFAVGMFGGKGGNPGTPDTTGGYNPYGPNLYGGGYDPTGGGDYSYTGSGGGYPSGSGGNPSGVPNGY